MAKKKKEMTNEEKLRALYNLQLIDSRIDEIRNLRGELPIEVEDLQDEIAGLDTRLNKYNQELEDTEKQIKDKQNFIEEAKVLMKRYQKQQENVRNNREFNALDKEIEYQELEIQLAEKHIKEFRAQIEHKKEVIKETQGTIENYKEHLSHKEKELDTIMADTEKEEKDLIKKSEDFKAKLEERLAKAYTRIRNSVKNGLAIAPIERGASGGSFFTIPPQVQMEIASRKKIITDEHSGRILVDAELAKEEEEKMAKLFGK